MIKRRCHYNNTSTLTTTSWSFSIIAMTMTMTMTTLVMRRMLIVMVIMLLLTRTENNNIHGGFGVGGVNGQQQQQQQEHETEVDPKLKRNLKLMNKSGIPINIYHFLPLTWVHYIDMHICVLMFVLSGVFFVVLWLLSSVFICTYMEKYVFREVSFPFFRIFSLSAI